MIENPIVVVLVMVLKPVIRGTWKPVRQKTGNREIKNETDVGDGKTTGTSMMIEVSIRWLKRVSSKS